MIAPDGFVVLADYVRSIQDEYEEIFEEQDHEQEPLEQTPMKRKFLPSFPLQVLVEESLNEILWEVPELWLYSAAGVCHKASNAVLSRIVCRDKNGLLRLTHSFFHVENMKLDLEKLKGLSLPFGSDEKENGYMSDELHALPLDSYYFYARLLAEFDGFYLTVPKGVLPEVSTMIMLKIIKGAGPEQESINELETVTEKLTNAAKSGVLPRREAFRLEHAPNMKVEQFKAIWREVSEQYPQLSKPGPKPKAKSKT